MLSLIYLEKFITKQITETALTVITKLINSACIIVSSCKLYYITPFACARLDKPTSQPAHVVLHATYDSLSSAAITATTDMHKCCTSEYYRTDFP